MLPLCVTPAQIAQACAAIDLAIVEILGDS